MCNLVESNSNCLILLANYNDEILDCSIIPITNSMVIGDFSSSGLKSLSYSHVEPDCNEKNTDNRTMLTFKSSPEFWWYFRNELLRSYTYRSNVWKNFNHTESAPCAILVNIHLSRAPKCVIDYKFGTEVQLLVNEKIEMDHVMSCLSTLGGAFSSLGDQFLDCAKIAGNISAKQFKIAMKLGDPMILMRCKLYFSISLIQCGRLKNARDIIRLVYSHSKSVPEDLQDRRTISMCLGIWAKLRLDAS